MNINFEESKARAFEEVSKFEDLRILSEFDKRKFDYPPDTIVWELKTELSLESSDSFGSIIFHIVISKEFPLNLPKVYLSPDTLQKVGFIPHVDPKRFICTFDPEKTRTNPENPEGIVYHVIQKAKNIIKRGISGIDNKDFETEFIGYWEQKYSKYDGIINNIIWVLNEEPTGNNLNVLILKNKFSGFKYIIHNNDLVAENLKKIIKSGSNNFEEIEAFYLDNLSIQEKPPYTINNKVFLEFCQQLSYDKLILLKKYINNNIFPKFIIFKREIESKIIYLGWAYEQIPTNIKGFRAGKFDNFTCLTSEFTKISATRLFPQVLNSERLIRRTEGNTIANSYKFLIAGLGSIGSNLTFYLNSYNKPAFKFIDFDNLKIENLGRHFLGLPYVNNSKPVGLKNFLLNNAPYQDISIKEDSIIDVINNDIEFINSADYIFIAIGKTNIENYIAAEVKNGLIKKPVFFIWVEPYLAAGHCIFLHPSNLIYDSFFDGEGYFKFNIIDSKEYYNNNPILSLSEAGCQTSYTPYSSNNVVLFLSQLFPALHKIIKDSLKKSCSFTWVGEKSLLTNLKIKVSNYGMGLDNGLYENKI